ncbi:hexose transporter [Sanghuangporus baumii]|uniref:Hexose transporter n=1 Tax=Sanghuangporus baumii TaxID=108892 RepID=A0A9Q5N4W8_SANBA|nr:hexose transporter [Sanghuangporus baumii]
MDKQVFYILSPRSKKHAQHAAESAKAPIENALPKKEEEKPEPEMMKDDEGKEEDVSESQKIGFDTNSPKDAQAYEEAVARFDAGAPGQTEDADKPEQKEKPAETKRVGTLQDKPEGPTNIGDARKEAKNIGALGALPFAPYLSDGIGRKPSVLLGATILWTATILQTFSASVGMFIGSRFMVGFGTTIAANAAPMLISEISYPPHRATLTSLYNCMWYSGSIAYGSFVLRDRRETQASCLPQCCLDNVRLCKAPKLLGVAPTFPRSRHSICSTSLAFVVRSRVASLAPSSPSLPTRSQDPLVEYELEEIKSVFVAGENAADANVGWSSFLLTPGNRRRLRIFVALAIFSQWSGNGLMSYYLSEIFTTIGIIDPTMQLLINGLLQIWNLFISIGAACLADKLGRRLLFIMSCAGMLAFFTMQTICSATFAETGSQSAAHAVIASIFLFYAAYDLAFTPLIVSYTIEILPFSIRAKGMTIFTFVLTISLIFNQYVNPVALEALGWKYYIVYCAWLAFELVYCSLFIIETKGMTLEETAVLFDGRPSEESADPSEVEDGTFVLVPRPFSKDDGGERKTEDANTSQVTITRSGMTLAPDEYKSNT